MKNIKILDCTLRDGARVVNCDFLDEVIEGVALGLTDSKIDLIEVGFLRDKINYEGNSTFYTDPAQIARSINLDKKGGTHYLAFIDYGMYDFSQLPQNNHTSIDGIRFGFTQKAFAGEREQLKQAFLLIKAKGYDVYFQDVNTLGYTDKELLELIEFANEIEPVSFGIVDTYGAMYQEDLERIFSIVDHNLKKEIGIDFHSHNNMQLSFALAQRIIQLCAKERLLIIDATLNGMGKGAGNLNTELIIDYMNRKLGYDYDFDTILDIIDEYLYNIKENQFWGYSIPSFMSGVYKAHPNNVIYLTEKFRISTKDIKRIMSLMDENSRQRYDYDNIKRIYTEYSAKQVDDREVISQLCSLLQNRKILLLVPGHSIKLYKKEIENYISSENPFVISVNFIYENCNLAFFANQRRYQHATIEKGQKILVTSNILQQSEEGAVINYYDYIETEGNYFDNSTLMVLNLFKKLQVEEIMIAGFDGFSKDTPGNYFDDSILNKAMEQKFSKRREEVNQELEKALCRYALKTEGIITVKFLTPSKFEKIFK